jgi:hypothetical protein
MVLEAKDKLVREDTVKEQEIKTGIPTEPGRV